jgi:hypothetical protein
MRNDHVFYGHIGGAYPAPETLEDAMRRARRLRSEALHDLLGDAASGIRSAVRRMREALRRRPAAKLQTC